MAPGNERTALGIQVGMALQFPRTQRAVDIVYLSDSGGEKWELRFEEEGGIVAVVVAVARDEEIGRIPRTSTRASRERRPVGAEEGFGEGGDL